MHNRKLEKKRVEAISQIIGERLHVELMAQRPRAGTDTLDNALLEKVLKRISEIEESAKHATHIDELDDLISDAELQGIFTAYFCPITEIENEGNLIISLIEEWGVPKNAISSLRDSVAGKLIDPDGRVARGALRVLFHERDSWEDFIDDYEDTMQRYTVRLFYAAAVLLLIAVSALHFAFYFSPLLLFGLLFAGAASSSISVMAKMPARGVSVNGKLDAYGRQVLSRIGIGVAASITGCGLLAWGLFPISIQNQTFTDALNACLSPAEPNKGIKTLIVLAIAMLFGISERTLSSFQQRVFGNSNKRQRE